MKNSMNKRFFLVAAILFAASSINVSLAKDAGVIDMHAHVLLPGQERSLNPSTPGSPEELKKQMKAAGVDMAGIMSMVPKDNMEVTRAYNDFILAQAKENDEFFAIASVHPLDGADAITEIERVAKAGAKGLKIHPFFQGFDPGHADVAAVVKVAGDNGLAVIMDSISADDGDSTGKFVNLALANPQTKIVLAHTAGARFHEMILFAVFAKGPYYKNNVYFDLSATAELYANSPRQDELMWTIREIGIDQFMFGSDFPVFDIKPAKDTMDDYGFSKEELTKIYSTNARKVFGLD